MRNALVEISDKISLATFLIKLLELNNNDDSEDYTPEEIVNCYNNYLSTIDQLCHETQLIYTSK